MSVTLPLLSPSSPVIEHWDGDHVTFYCSLVPAQLLLRNYQLAWLYDGIKVDGCSRDTQLSALCAVTIPTNRLRSNYDELLECYLWNNRDNFTFHLPSSGGKYDFELFEMTYSSTLDGVFIFEMTVVFFILVFLCFCSSYKDNDDSGTSNLNKEKNTIRI